MSLNLQNKTKLLNLWRKLWRVFKKNPTEANKQAYECCSRSCNLAIKNFFRDREQSILQSGDPIVFYNYVKSQLQSKKPIPALRDSNGSLVSDPLELATLLNTYFTTVHQKDNGTVPLAFL